MFHRLTTASTTRLIIYMFGVLFFSITLILGTSMAGHAAGPATLVKDIDPGVFGSLPEHLTNVDGTLFFAANDGQHGNELWRSNGTSSGTTQVKQINPSGSDALPHSQFQNMMALGDVVFFMADDGTHGLELWRSDGSAAGTNLVKDINPGPNGSTAGDYSSEFINVNGTLFFQANDGTHGYELWKSDGTASGTSLVKDVNPGASNSSPAYLTNVNGTLFFQATDVVHGIELWRSDGTTNGTMLVKDLNSGASNSLPQSLTNVNGTLFFSAYDSTGSTYLWRSDGTANGTSPVNGASNAEGPFDLVNVNGTLFFFAYNAVQGTQLWRSDGTANGTMSITNLPPADNPSGLWNLTNVAGTLFFTPIYANSRGNELWRSDGTSSSTTLIEAFYPGNAAVLGNLTNVSGTLFFTGDDPTTGQELWQSNGTPAGTTLVQDIYPGPIGSIPAWLTLVNGTLFFQASDPEHGPELWSLPIGSSTTATPTATSSPTVTATPTSTGMPTPTPTIGLPSIPNIYLPLVQR